MLRQQLMSLRTTSSLIQQAALASFRRGAMSVFSVSSSALVSGVVILESVWAILIVSPGCFGLWFATAFKTLYALAIRIEGPTPWRMCGFRRCERQVAGGSARPFQRLVVTVFNRDYFGV